MSMTMRCNLRLYGASAGEVVHQRNRVKTRDHIVSHNIFSSELMYPGLPHLAGPFAASTQSEGQ